MQKDFKEIGDLLTRGINSLYNCLMIMAGSEKHTIAANLKITVSRHIHGDELWFSDLRGKSEVHIILWRFCFTGFARN